MFHSVFAATEFLTEDLSRPSHFEPNEIEDIFISEERLLRLVQNIDPKKSAGRIAYLMNFPCPMQNGPQNTYWLYLEHH